MLGSKATQIEHLERQVSELRKELLVSIDRLEKRFASPNSSGDQPETPPVPAPSTTSEQDANGTKVSEDQFDPNDLALHAKAPENVTEPPATPSYTYSVTSSQAISVFANRTKSKPRTAQPSAATEVADLPAAPVPAARNAQPAGPSFVDRWLATTKTWLLTGNLVAKLGLVILFIGVAFLLKYVAATITIPIELRLAGVVAADLGLLVWGWRLRTRRREIGLPVQGTAIAILMLVIFGAHQRYDLIHAGFAFGLLVCLTVFTCLLAVLQNAPWLAAFGIAGGFACPLLLSTGQGKHIALFSYYALLNAGVFALAITRSWRPLNLLGFAFTFVVGTAWGVLRYTPENYLSAQGFLILFFLCYVAISLAFAHQQQARLKNYVDATLVLGTPLLAFGLQVGLVKDKPFGLALSTLALGGFYLATALVLLKRGRERWGVMLEAYAALGVIFGTLAIPFALDARWTSAAWALEGAGFVWLGLRWRRVLVWIFGLLLQFGAGLSFIAAATDLTPYAATSAHLWLGCLLLAASGFAVALGLRKHANESDGLIMLAESFLTLSAIWLLAGCWTEAIVRTRGGALANWLVAGALFTALLLYGVSVRLSWPMARQPAYAAQIAGAVALGVVSAPGWSWTTMFEANRDAPLVGVVMLAAAAWATAYLARRTQPAATQAHPTFSSAMLLWAAIWWFGPAINIAAGRLIAYLPQDLGSPYARWTALYALGVAATAIAAMALAPRLAWPQLRRSAFVCWGMLVLVTADILHTLYETRTLPQPASWLAWAVLWSSGEFLMARWSRGGPELGRGTLKLLHLLRSSGPWLALWPVGAILIDGWLIAPAPDPYDLTQDSWVTDAAWSNYLPTWAMMLALVFLLRRCLAGRWPAAPLADWYRTVVIPGATTLMVVLAVSWNLKHDGAMAPLPYLPLLNPLDLTTGFVLMLGASVLRQLAGPAAADAGLRKSLQQLRLAGLAGAYIWFNLILLRSAAHYLGIDYRLPDLAASQVVQSMLSLVWSASALVLMRMAARRAMRRSWWTGAAMLGVVVLKLFMVDLDNSGSIARVVSFVGVGLLLLLVGYFAPYPKTGQRPPATPPTAPA
jgi:uncharacterized membrane protein